ncbi:MAG: tetratricopeptide repeat protein [Desulfobulbaceae bacterium]|nr:tetratricopeptide repeat protein [Desulfobulbaceae bacterium]
MQAGHYGKFIFRIMISLSVLFLYTTTLMAVAFPFREFNEGDSVPDVTLKSFEAGRQAVTFSGIKGKPFIAVFWGADLPEKIEHSAKVLAELENLASFLQERNVQRLSVNVQNDDAAAINEVLNRSGSTMALYVDENQKAYATLGIFVMPTVLLVDKDGNVAAGMGYSRDLVDRLKGAVEVMLGEKTAEQVAAELRPEMKVASDQEKAGRRHFDFGMVMLKRGQMDAAVREFAKAVEIDPEMSEAQLRLGCLYLRGNELDRAENAINKALEADPGSVDGRICRGELLRLKGQTDEAATELQAAVALQPDKYDAYYYLGRVLEDQKKHRDAMDMYKKAYGEILKQSAAGK